MGAIRDLMLPIYSIDCPLCSSWPLFLSFFLSLSLHEKMGTHTPKTGNREASLFCRTLYAYMRNRKEGRKEEIKEPSWL